MTLYQNKRFPGLYFKVQHLGFHRRIAWYNYYTGQEIPVYQKSQKYQESDFYQVAVK
jgi:hypothetical protein